MLELPFLHPGASERQSRTVRNRDMFVKGMSQIFEFQVVSLYHVPVSRFGDRIGQGHQSIPLILANLPN